MPFVRLQRVLKSGRRAARWARGSSRLRRNRLAARKAWLTVIVAPGRMSVVYRWLKGQRQPAVLRCPDGRRFVVRPQAWFRRRPTRRPWSGPL